MTLSFYGRHLKIASFILIGLAFLVCGGCSSGNEDGTIEDGTISDRYVLALIGTPASYVLPNASYSFTPSLAELNPPSGPIFSVTNLPSWASFDNDTGRLYGTPGFVDIGVYSNIVLSASLDSATVSLPVFSIIVCPECIPRILYTDIVAGPTSGGEIDQGAYLSIFGVNFGGDVGAIEVTIGGEEVARIMLLDNAVSQPFANMGVPLQRITVQVGALGGMALGDSGAIEVTIAGVNSNADHSFTNQPGDIIYVSLTGSDLTGDGSFSNPYRRVQNQLGNNPAYSAWEAGDFIVMRGGTWTDVGYGNKFLAISMGLNKDGSLPSGIVGDGYLSIMGYPGETVNIEVQNTGLSGGANIGFDGGITGPGSGQATRANFVTISNLSIHDDNIRQFMDRGDGPIYSSSSGTGWRVVNNETTARIGFDVDQRASGIGGAYVDAVILGNYIHDIQGIQSNNSQAGSGNLINHGMYFDHNLEDSEIAYNHVENIEGGNSIQWFGVGPFDGVDLHHNLLDGSNKHGLNASAVRNLNAYNNIIMNMYQAGARISSANAQGHVYSHNTFYNNNTQNSSNYAAIYSEGQQASNGPRYENNVIVTVNGQSRGYYMNNTVNDSATVLDNNLYFGTGVGPGKDANAINADPAFNNAVGGDFRLQAGSSAVDAGKTLATPILDDILTNFRMGAPDTGAVELFP